MVEFDSKKYRFQNCIQKNFSPVTKNRLSPPSNKILAENLAVFAGILLPNDAREKKSLEQSIFSEWCLSQLKRRTKQNSEKNAKKKHFANYDVGKICGVVCDRSSLCLSGLGLKWFMGLVLEVYRDRFTRNSQFSKKMRLNLL